ncbi:KR domain-containing protein [Nocardia seriolae]|uniref:Ketoreductase domain-containing protein n=1 Tax=Nocardia seriolae TaxID=37332 RepID=A0ABC9YT28_9NOCA|nr:KR domain-containing protein [Nocardia seriolae]BEK94383.1 hypothetical protein NSER024013_22890 [Nocardia seriolae]GAM46782.1 modular polyketide synthase [Nocardia seriolae]GAP28654.1 hypothetical protein NSK11_contig00040-0008 [Nocardia seriolae]
MTVQPVHRFVWRPVEVAALPPEPSIGLLGRRIAVVGGSGESAARMLAVLRGAGASPARLAPPHEGGDVAEFYRSTGPLDGIVDLNYERPFDLSDPGDWESPLLQTIGLLRQTYDDWRAEGDCRRLFYLAVTRMDGRHGYADPGRGQPLGGLWAGLAKGLPREFDTVNIRVLDLPATESPDRAAVLPLSAAMADLVCRELYRWGPFEIGHYAGRRYTLTADRSEVPAPAIELGPGDVVVMSGGGRGIGWALARRLADRYRCRVIVTGRSPQPDPVDPLIMMADNEFREYRARVLVAAARSRSLTRARTELARAQEARQLAAGLAAARADGLDIVYHRCDVTDPVQVRALLAAAGPQLAGVVHNAGVDAPARLPVKSPASVRRTAGVKVTGLLNLLAALPESPPVRFFSTAGSLAGRWGGMVGQLEYGAANDAMSRIGLWAASPDRDVPVATMCWPTWERLGIITNYEANLAYMSAMGVEEGLRHWEREIVAGTVGEVTLVGEFGKALLPSLLRGYPPTTGLTGVAHLVNRLLLLGEPIRFRVGALLETELRLTTDRFPACTDFRVDGRPAIPLSLLLEFLRSLGDWVQPDDGPRPASALRDIHVDLSALALPETGVRLRATAEGRWGAHRDWVVRVRVTREGTPVALATLVYAATAGDRPGVETPSTPADPEAVSLGAPVHRLHWNGHVFRVGRELPDGRSAEVDADRPRDLLPGVPSPLPELPLNQLETLLRQAYRRTPAQPVRRLTIESIEIAAPLSGSDGRVTAEGRTSTAYAPDGRVRLLVHGIRYRKG